MKKSYSKVLSMILCAFLLSSLGLSNALCAKAETSSDEQAVKPIIEIIDEQEDIASEHEMFNTDNYEDALQGYTLNDKAILEGYVSPLTGIMWRDGQNYTVDEFLEALKKRTTTPKWYIAFDQNSARDIWICKNIPSNYQWKYRNQKDDLVVSDVVFFTSPEYGLPQFAKDILSDEIYRSPLHKSGEEYSKITFYGMPEWGQVVFYFKGNDAIVRCYDTFFPQAYLNSSEPKDYTWEQFQEYAVVYSDYLLELQEKGIELAGSLSFNQFVEQYENGTITLDSQKNWSTWIVWGVIACALLAVAIVLLGKFFKKKRTV